MKKNSVQNENLYVRVNGQKYKMEKTTNDNLIARGVEFQSGENNFVFGDSRMTLASRMSYKGDKKMCLIHTFPINCTDGKNLMTISCNAPGVYDVMLIRYTRGKKSELKVQVRFSSQW